MKYWFLALLLIAAIACTSDDDEQELGFPTPGLFEVLTATPRPEATSTAVPTAPAVPIASATPIPTPTPVPIVEGSFPAHIDLDLVIERPSDEEIFAAWGDYLMDSEVRLVGDTAGTHYCADGTTWFPTSEYGDHAWWAFE